MVIYFLTFVFCLLNLGTLDERGNTISTVLSPPPSSRKVIFLDFDGVLTSVDYWEYVVNAEYPGGTRQFNEDFNRGNLDALKRARYSFDPSAIENLRAIIDQTGAEIVISSDWRYLGIDLLREIWEKLRFPGKIIDMTSMDPKAGRESAIALWLSRNPVEHYVILDDDFGVLSVGEMRNLIRVHPQVGLLRKDAMNAVRMLNKEPVQHDPVRNWLIAGFIEDSL